MRFRKLTKQIKQKQKINTEKELEYARFTDRIKALITDMFMIYAPILYAITYVVLNGKDEFQSSQIAQFFGVLLYGITYAVLLSKFGQTPGKKAYEMIVVDDITHEKIGFFRAFCRFVAFLFTATTLLGLFLPFYTKQKKALHDIICKTVVITKKD